MLDKIKENWEKCIGYAINVKTRYIDIGDFFDIAEDAPDDVKRAYQEYLKSIHHLEEKSVW